MNRTWRILYIRDQVSDSIVDNPASSGYGEVLTYQVALGIIKHIDPVTLILVNLACEGTLIEFSSFCCIGLDDDSSVFHSDFISIDSVVSGFWKGDEKRIHWFLPILDILNVVDSTFINDPAPRSQIEAFTRQIILGFIQDIDETFTKFDSLTYEGTLIELSLLLSVGLDGDSFPFHFDSSS